MRGCRTHDADDPDRPRTCIRRLIDPTWEPLIPTPPFPECPSGHSALGPVPRRFSSIVEAADRAGISRVFGGIHYESGNDGGRTVGRCVGETIARRLNGGGAR